MEENIIFLNNKVHKGDFENVISYIDAYNTAVSTSIDDLTAAISLAVEVIKELNKDIIKSF